MQIPTIGLPDTTEDVKLQNSLGTLQTVINGNLDDSNLKSPNNGVPRLLLNANGVIVGSTTYSTGGQSFILVPAGTIVAMGASLQATVPMWTALPSWAVVGKTTNGFVQFSLANNNTTPGVNINASLMKLTGLGGTGSQINYAGTIVSGSTTASFTNPLASANGSVVSSTFALPTDSAAYFLVVTLSGGSGTIAPNALVQLSCNLFVTNT